MSKYQGGDYIQFPRQGFRDGRYSELSIGAFSMLVWLKELEHQYCNSQNNSFFQTDEQLAEKMGISAKSIRRYRKELIAQGYIEYKVMHFPLPDRIHYSEKPTGHYTFINGW